MHDEVSGILTYAAVEKRSASLSQSATRFHLENIWATTFPNPRKTHAQAKVMRFDRLKSMFR